MKKRNKGISLISLAVAVCILIVISSMLLYNAKNGIKIRKLKMMQNDIALLDDTVNSYYTKYGAIPAEIKYNVTPLPFEENKSPNDNDVYYVLDLKALEGITLNYGADYNKIATEEDVYNYNDIYVINEQSHQIYYARGIEMDSIIYYGNVSNDEINLNERKWTKMIAEGGQRFFGLDNRGTLYVMEDYYEGKINENMNYTKADDFFKESTFLEKKKIVKTSAGSAHTVAIDSEGKVYTWGNNGCGRLGNGTENNSTVPICISEIEENVLKGKNIVEISAGYEHTVAIDSEGKVYTWGKNSSRQLGDGTRDNSYEPICISETEGNVLKGKNIVEISAGYSHTVAIDSEGKIYVWGKFGNKGGIEDSGIINQEVPLCISDIEEFGLKDRKIINIGTMSKQYITTIDENGEINLLIWMIVPE